MAKRKDLFPVEKDRALQHATMTYRRAWAGQVVDFKSWGTAELDPKPLDIYDLNGELLFYEFTALDGNNELGRLKASATKRLGTTIATVELGPRRWDPDKGISEARKKTKKMFPKASIKDAQLVCYSYPKIGARIDLKESGRPLRSLIFDIADGNLIDRFGSDELEGNAAWSFIDHITPAEQENRVKSWDLRDMEREAALSKTPRLFEKGFTAKEAKTIREKFVIPTRYVISFYSEKVLKFGPRCDAHDCFELYAQKTNVYCAVATGQMILDFYRYHYDQDDIATAMSTGAGGTSNPNQVAGYESLSKNCLNATYDSTANWSEAKAEIDANRPVKSGVPGHARACAGWKRQNIYLIGQTPKRWLRIYDPWPWNADICAGGQIYWEDWDTETHTNFIYVRHRTTTCS
jgi:hypothetical protein